MTPEAFIARWKDNSLTERAGAQAHFDDLCELLGVEKPRDPDNYCFERGAKKAGGGDGWADVWKRGHFGWENKKPGGDLDRALKQLTDYALQLESPPLLVVSDRERIVVHTAFTGYPDQPREIRIDELADAGVRQTLRWVFTDPEKLRPEKSTAAITAEAAGQFSALAQAMRARGIDGQRVAHFLVQCLFCMFAEDETLLPGQVFTGILKNAGSDTRRAADRIGKLFAAMQKKTGGVYGDHDIAWFNGGLFKTADVPELTADDLAGLHRAAADMDWRAIDPTIFGTLFERGLDPAARAPLGAHYTDTGTIAKLIDPLIRQPLSTEWEAAKVIIAAGQGKGTRTDAFKAARSAYQGFMLRLNKFRVLDPACGSGNFLYLALAALRDIEKRAHVEAAELGLATELVMQTGPHNLLGIELNEFAAELARVTVWIGDIQWCRRNGYAHATHPILRPLDGIENRDALINADASEAPWPVADVIVGNPPFIGDKKMRGELGDDYTRTLRKTYEGRVPGGADLVTYWFEKARAQIAAGTLRAAGLVATNSIRGGANRKVLDRILADLPIFEAWSDEPWVNDGAAVRVSLVCFGEGQGARLDGADVAAINADLTSSSPSDDSLDFTQAKPLAGNAGTAFIGTQKTGAFDIPGELARKWLKCPNPNGRPNSDVVRPWANGQDLTKRSSDTWIVDYGVAMSEADASLFEMPFSYLQTHVQTGRDGKREVIASKWWLHTRPRPDMRLALRGMNRYIATPRVAKHRFFVWLPIDCLPDSRLTVIARSDDATFGTLSSRAHTLWSLATCSWHGVGNDPTYNAQSVFETFPFPPGMTPRDTPAGPAAEAVAVAARRLDELRDAWLNPPEWVDWVRTAEEEHAGFPARPVAKAGHEAELKKRTLTNLYNARPAWLDHAHRALDAAVAAAYGWADYTPEMPDDEILRRLLALNRERATPTGPASSQADDNANAPVEPVSR